jgi:hypothetical protein
VSPGVREPRPAVATLRERIGPPEIAFAALLALGAVIVLYETRGLNFFFDDWETILWRRGFSAGVLLRPHGPHLSLIPILIYKLWLALFGASSYLPFRVMAALDMVTLGLVLGIACRRWWGRWWGLAPVALLMTLGSGAISLLWSFEVCYAVADAAGVIALVALSRRSRNGDIVACVALATSLASCSQGIGFVVGAAVLIVLRGNWRRSAWVVVIPGVLYALWYLKYGHATSETQLSLWRGSLVYTLKALSSTLAGALGVSTPSTDLPPQIDPSLGEPLAFAVIAVFVVALARGWRPPPIFWAALSVAVALWIASSLSDATGNRRPTDSRYLATSVMLLCVCLCTGVPHPRLRGAGAVAAVIALAVVCVTNAGQFLGVRNEMLSATVASRAQTGALLMLRGTVGPDFAPDAPFGPGLINDVYAGKFYSAVDAFGTTADTPAQLLAAGQGPSVLADRVLERGEVLGLVPASGAESVTTSAPTVMAGTVEHRGGCLILSSAPVVIEAAAGKLQLTASSRAPLAAAIGRFASGYEIPLGQVPAGRVDTVAVPRDREPQIPWRMQLSGAGGRVCRLA